MEKVTHVPIAREALIDKYPDVFGEHHIRVIAPVNSPTAWISSMVTVPKTNGKLRVCLDPRDLNRAVQRAHYPLPTYRRHCHKTTRLQSIHKN